MRFTFLTIILIGLLTSCGNAQKIDKQNENASAIKNADLYEPTVVWTMKPINRCMTQNKTSHQHWVFCASWADGT